MKMFWRVLYEGIFKNLPSSQAVGGKYFKKLRMIVVSKFVEYCGSNVNIEPKAIISHKLKIGDRSGIGKNSYCAGDITIGKDVMMGPECVILTRNHAFDRVDIPMRMQGFAEEKPVVIEDDVWIGWRVTILSGIRVGKGSIIGAGAVVTKDVPSYAIVAGNPATVRKYRK